MKDAKREIISLALLLEDVSDLTVFVDYSGHVKSVKIRVYEDYRGEQKELLYKDFYTDFRCDTQRDYVAIKTFLQFKIEEYTAV
jgi:hypothetical protein